MSLTTSNLNLAGLRLAVLAPISWPTPPPGYGPWEQIAFNIADGMRRRGLDVTLFATGNSHFDGKIASVIPVGLNEDPALDDGVFTAIDVPFTGANNPQCASINPAVRSLGGTTIALV